MHAATEPSICCLASSPAQRRDLSEKPPVHTGRVQGLGAEHGKTSVKGTEQNHHPCILHVKSINFVQIRMTKDGEGSEEALSQRVLQKIK